MGHVKSISINSTFDSGVIATIEIYADPVMMKLLQYLHTELQGSLTSDALLAMSQKMFELEEADKLANTKKAIEIMYTPKYNVNTSSWG